MDTQTLKGLKMEKLFIQDGNETREFTSEEYDQALRDRQTVRLLSEKAEQIANAKAALLTKLGITADEAALLLS